MLTGLLAIGIAGGLNRLIAAFPSSTLYEALTHLPDGAAARPLDTYLTALFAFSAVRRRRGRARRGAGCSSPSPAVYVVAAFTSTQASLQSLVLSATLGAGDRHRRPLRGGQRQRAAGRTAGSRPRWHGGALPVVRLEAAAAPARRPPGLPGDDGGRRPAQPCGCFDRELIASGAVYNLYRMLRLRAELAPAPALSLERVTEHRSLLSLAAQRRPACATPRLVAGLPCGPGQRSCWCTSRRSGTPLQDPTDDQLDELWGSVGRLHMPAASPTAG